MTTIAKTYINALLADAAYVDLLEEPLNSPGNQDLLGKRMTPTLAAYIAANFEVVSAINTPDSVLGDGSGFDATVWRGKAGGDYAGQVFISTRGTEPDAGGADLLADADPALATAARSQSIDMLNWWTHTANRSYDPRKNCAYSYRKRSKLPDLRGCAA
jgi:hypothetical protein